MQLNERTRLAGARRRGVWWTCLAAVLMVSGSAASAQERDEKQPLTAAVLKFHERTDQKGTAEKVTELLAAELAVSPDLLIVERDELERVLKEIELNVSGAVAASEAIQVGRLTGARLLISGSVIDLENDRYLVAKVISTETSRVLGASAKGKAGDGLGELVQKVAGEITQVIRDKGTSILPEPVSREDRLAKVSKRLEGQGRPAVLIRVKESHIGGQAVDPAAQTELTHWCQSLGFRTIDPEQGNESEADFVITGEGLTEIASRRGNLVSIQARLEVKVVNRKTGDVVAADRQTVRKVDATEFVAGKQALQEAAAELAERMLPPLAEGKAQPAKSRKERSGN